ncbi:MAG: Glycosyltransferase [Microgenomates group bacterium GW2011_GWF2_45_18]|nr:MAG: Glycosyltransferase [Microgenomates group bacterium GW2011_GWF1_44_10]KKU02269.1 MAG: Glycosyltransferase [Microgenomates group bacterium GW2011_GWF2_45_18]HAU99266.1 glycosyltransferase family 2 protein [Candidatus Paceibacterota bacterium]HAX01797.1 glycosyltransferase family 2 protein [Candidatus Paceibacterota bacterium]
MQKTSKLNVVVIIPTYNEQENIKKMIPALREEFAHSCSDYNMSVLVVDDSSPDGTGETVRAFASRYENVHLLSKATKEGLGSAYLAGMEFAFRTLKADVVFEFDADFSHDMRKIPEFLKKIDQGFDMVLGSRYVKGGSIPSNWGVHRKLLSGVGNLFINIVMFSFAIRDWTTGFRAITKRVYDSVHLAMSSSRFTGYTFQIGFLHKAIRAGFTISEVPIHFIDRTYGKSKLGAEYVKNTLIYVLQARFQEIIHLRVFKFGVVGLIGFSVNTLGLFIFSRIDAIRGFASTLATFTGWSFVNVSGLSSALGAECAIVSNFILNNAWTFKDRKETNPLRLIPKFLQFNLSSFGAVAIQFVIVGFGTSLTGQETLSRMFWLVVATAVGMVVNYFVYSRIIWREKKT